MKKTKKYLVVIKHYTIRKREPDLELVALCDTETEALKKCKKQYSDIIEVWAENWPQDPISHKKMQKYIDYGDCFATVNKDINGKPKVQWINPKIIEEYRFTWMKEHKK